ncbi:hypothetical protein F7R25_04195 [Burkholderia stagnalis]|uniref:Uncharacterized protein n=1 Tax=Burkholderia stagnalis TaxID=1503054 RepID=A0A6L3N344_9BURK|nr:F0F1 ATP synthase subunit delta [Burkholderia stagnalis]KAB0640706.1 hypothetical protein F7R25_04195 [Burkholderia stagnalis]VWB06816.1 hypothetical protein BST28156_00143 [Burkholderia stagnalis]
MTTTNNEPSIKELARMHLVFGFSQVQYFVGKNLVKHQSITWTDIGKSKEFFLERARFIDSGDNLDEIYDDKNQFVSLQSLREKMDHYGYQMAEELTNDIDFAKELIPIDERYAKFFSSKVRNDKEVIKLILEHCDANRWKPGGSNVKVLCKENRLGVAYEIIKEFPEYEVLLGATIKKKIGSMSLVEYVEKKALQKSLRKNLKKEVKPAVRTKI